MHWIYIIFCTKPSICNSQNLFRIVSIPSWFWHVYREAFTIILNMLIVFPIWTKCTFRFSEYVKISPLTHWGRVMHICVGKLTIIGSDNGLSSGRRQAIIWTSAGILLIGPSGTNFNEISIAVQTFSFKKIHLKMASGKCRPFCLGLNVLSV